MARFQQAQVHTIFHAGDVTGAPTLQLLAGFEVWIARGNMDVDPRLASAVTQTFGEGRLAQVHDINLDGVRIALLHGESWTRLETLIRAAMYDYVIHGHTHVPALKAVGPTHIINPGALGNSRWYCPTCAILDLSTGDVQWIEL